MHEGRQGLVQQVMTMTTFLTLRIKNMCFKTLPRSTSQPRHKWTVNGTAPHLTKHQRASNLQKQHIIREPLVHDASV